MDEDTITLGLLADLTGIFAPLVIDITDAQTVYFDLVNAAGGIGGKEIELLVEDTNYNVEQHNEKYEKLRDQVVAFSQSTGSPMTVSILPKIAEDNVLVIPLSWYSGWPDRNFDGGLVFEQGTNYCIEAMNVLDFMHRNGGQTVAIVGFPGDYGQGRCQGRQDRGGSPRHGGRLRRRRCGHSRSGPDSCDNRDRGFWC